MIDAEFPVDFVFYLRNLRPEKICRAIRYYYSIWDKSSIKRTAVSMPL
jgi:hypothetical protein